MDQTFPADFMCIGGKSFEMVYRHRKEFVDFTLNEMTEPKGLFKKWQDFCKNKVKDERDTPGIVKCDSQNRGHHGKGKN